ncbi:MAG: hypothetical protein HYZ54_13680 [Ignavibacteriae bacterium]|nr:hypothetical protein [Ignavibacteriota bacterium]
MATKWTFTKKYAASNAEAVEIFMLVLRFLSVSTITQEQYNTLTEVQKRYFEEEK